MTQDEQLIDYLNLEEGLYDALLRDLSLSKEKRVSVKRAFIGSFLLAVVIVALNSKSIKRLVKLTGYSNEQIQEDH